MTIKTSQAQDSKLSRKMEADPLNYQSWGGEEIPAGGWRGGGEDIPAGGWRGGGEDIPVGGWRGGGEDIPAGGWRASALQPQVGSELELLPEGGFRTVVDVYRSVDGTSYFKFSFYPIGDYYEIDILAMPSYGLRDSGLHSTHRLNSGRGGYKICFGDPTVVKTITMARKWAAAWSEHTVRYIRNGTPFPNS